MYYHILSYILYIQQVENLKVYDIEAIGMLGFTQDQIDQTKLENEEAKFTCYVFDITDKRNIGKIV